MIALLLAQATLLEGERLDGFKYTGLKEARFNDEADARAYLASHEGKGELRRDGDAWAVRVPVTVELLYSVPKAPYRYADGIYYKPTGSVFATREEAEAFKKANPHVEAIKETTLDGKPRFSASWTEKEDLVVQARKRLQEDGLCDPWVLRAPPAPWTIHISRFRFEDREVHPPEAVRTVFTEIDAPGGGGGLGCEVMLFKPDPAIEHQVVGQLIWGTWTVRRSPRGSVIHRDAGGGWHVAWKHREGVYVEVSGFNPEQPELVDAHLKRFPSMWKDDFRFDSLPWFEVERNFRLKRMKDVLHDPKPSESELLPYNTELLRLAARFEIPRFWSTIKPRSPEELEAHYKELLQAWDARKITPRKTPLHGMSLRLLEARD
ncbi:MAG TPA: hypothetical protein VF950_19955 [Planctomycetota bacterium]